jgi:cell division protease FtsH
VVSLGGYVVEQMVFGDITTGASNDIATSTAVARAMVTKYGMSDKLGPIAFDTSGQRFLGSQHAVGEIHSSESVAAMIDAEVAKIMTESLERAKKILTEKREILNNMSAELIKLETIDREDFEKLLILNGIKPKVTPEGLDIVS